MSRKRRLRRSDALPPTRWPGLEVLDSTRPLNARCFGLLAEAARAEDARSAYGGVFGFPKLWTQVDSQVCQRAGACPVLLLDFHFDVPERWSRMVDGVLTKSSVQAALFPATSATPLLRDILTEARIIARSETSTARFLFGMAPAVCAAIAGLSGADIERIAVEHVRELRPRWEGNRAFWKKLLESAIDNDLEAVAKIHVQCIQLLGTDLARGS